MSDARDAELIQELSTLSAQLDAATHRQLVLMREVDRRQVWAAQGARSCAHWLSWRIGLSPATARDRLRVAHALAALPLLDAALAAGQLSYSKARAIARVATPANEETLLNMALHSTASQLERICRGIRQATEEDEGEPVRYVSSRSMHDGTIKVEARLHADEASLLLETLTQLQMSMNRDQEEDAPRASRPDALVRLVQSFLAHALSPAGEEPQEKLASPRTGADHAQVVVHLEPSRLEEGAMDATLEDGTRVSAETSRRMIESLGEGRAIGPKTGLTAR